ncbi:hypothetical protein H7X68_03630 [Candidatus Saccharibacteria bacterium]|nr:hypothetical protein [Candidatus Saccharibacteria bacterium]
MKYNFERIAAIVNTSYCALSRSALMLLLIAILLLTIAIDKPAYGQSTDQSVTDNAQVHTTSARLTNKVAPGDLLPVSVKLANFGGGKRVDVLVRYEIVAVDGTQITTSNETVAVETTNNFVKNLQIPLGTAEGVYTAKTSITYKDQLVPATTKFTFQVEPTILGVFRSTFLLYGSIALIVGAVMVLLGYSMVKRHKASRLRPIDYTGVPRDQRVFYELISDTVMSMRQRVGDEALDIAMRTKGLVIDGETGRIIKLTDTPSKVIAELIVGYEKVLGKKVSFSFRKDTSSQPNIKLKKGTNYNE